MCFCSWFDTVEQCERTENASGKTWPQLPRLFVLPAQYGRPGPAAHTEQAAQRAWAAAAKFSQTHFLSSHTAPPYQTSYKSTLIASSSHSSLLFL